MRTPLGRGYWAVAPFAPEPPFRLYAGQEHPPIEVQHVGRLHSARDEQLTLLVPIKVRPVLVITEPSARYNEVLVLRLRRLNILDEAQREEVRKGRAEDLFHLRPEGFPELPEENAAIITTSLRLPVSALDTSTPLGVVNENELRVIHERLVRAHALDLRNLVLDKAQDLVRALRAGAGE